MAAARTDIAPTETSPHLVFIPEKNQFKWNSDLNTLRDFWIAELEGGDENNLVSVNSNGHTEVLKFESSSSSSCPFPSEGNRALRSLSPSFSVFRTTTSFCPAFEPKFASFSLYRSSPCLLRPTSLTSSLWGPC